MQQKTVSAAATESSADQLSDLLPELAAEV